jgi:DNA ligase-1
VAKSEAAATSEPSADDGEEEVEKDELEDDEEGITAVEGAAASKT